MKNNNNYQTIDDATLESSLRDHGLVAFNYKSDAYICAYKHDSTYEIGFFYESEIRDFLNGKSWVSKKEIKNFITKHLELEQETFNNLPVIYRLHCILKYFGVQDFMGPKIYEMSLEEAIKEFTFKIL